MDNEIDVEDSNEDGQFKSEDTGDMFDDDSYKGTKIIDEVIDGKIVILVSKFSMEEELWIKKQ